VHSKILFESLLTVHQVFICRQEIGLVHEVHIKDEQVVQVRE